MSVVRVFWTSCVVCKRRFWCSFCLSPGGCRLVLQAASLASRPSDVDLLCHLQDQRALTETTASGGCRQFSKVPNALPSWVCRPATCDPQRLDLGIPRTGYSDWLVLPMLTPDIIPCVQPRSATGGSKQIVRPLKITSRGSLCCGFDPEAFSASLPVEFVSQKSRFTGEGVDQLPRSNRLPAARPVLPVPMRLSWLRPSVRPMHSADCPTANGRVFAGKPAAFRCGRTSWGAVHGVSVNFHNHPPGFGRCRRPPVRRP